MRGLVYSRVREASQVKKGDPADAYGQNLSVYPLRQQSAPPHETPKNRARTVVSEARVSPLFTFPARP